MAYERNKRTGSGAGSRGEVLPWAACAGAAAALAAAVTVALITRGQVEGLRSGNKALAERVGKLEAANSELVAGRSRLEKVNSDLLAKQTGLSDRLKAAEDRCAALAGRVTDEKRVRELAAAEARRAVAGLRRTATTAPRTDAARAAADAEKRGGEIAEIREKVEKKEMTAEEGREAIAKKVEEGLKQVLPAETVERMEKARQEREKNMTPEQKAQADKARAAILDGIGEFATIRQKVQEGKMTEEEGRKAMRELWRARAEEFRKMREKRVQDQQKTPAPKEQF
ncbi:MAG: hypothetical protein ACYTGB_13215 [Planctomycetota bacterium]|jgi:hypothetical protein